MILPSIVPTESERSQWNRIYQPNLVVSNPNTDKTVTNPAQTVSIHRYFDHYPWIHHNQFDHEKNIFVLDLGRRAAISGVLLVGLGRSPFSKLPQKAQYWWQTLSRAVTFHKNEEILDLEVRKIDFCIEFWSTRRNFQLATRLSWANCIARLDLTHSISMTNLLRAHPLNSIRPKRHSSSERRARV